MNKIASTGKGLFFDYIVTLSLLRLRKVKRLIPGTILLLLSGPLFAAPETELWEYWLAHDAASEQRVDHARWQIFLDSHTALGADGIVRVDYAQANLSSDSGGLRVLQAYIEELGNIDPRALNRREQMAYWINLYNALTVEVVLRYPQKDSILRMGERLFSSGPWDDEVITLSDQAVTLNDIEHRILRPIWRDRRIHFVVNCASLGCPNLSPSAYTADNVEDQLKAAENAYINHPRGLTLKDNKVTLSSIFDWYQSDFADSEKALLSYLAQHHERHAASLKNYAGRISYAYDWTLNRR